MPITSSRIERLLEQHEPDDPVVLLSFTDDVSLRSNNWTRLELGIPLLPTER